MKKLLFISSRLNEKNKNGAYAVAKRNFKILSEITEIDLYRIDYKGKISNICNTIFNSRIENITLNDEKKIIEKIKKNGIDIVFLDTSVFGFLAEKIKKNFKSIEIITFCHDIDREQKKSLSLKMKKNSLLDIVKYIKLKIEIKKSEINEKKSFLYSNKIVTLNKRDTLLLKNEYGYNSSGEIPVSFEDETGKDFSPVFPINKKNFLFVGVAFLPNIEGLEFFIREVIPYIDINLYIVGKNMEKYKSYFEKLHERVFVIGTVEKLDRYYNDADAVIAPIFCGGGMKVKTAEALMYGKTIFGTSEAFEGYEVNSKYVGGICNSAIEFREKIENYIEYSTNEKINWYSREKFLNRYSNSAALEKMKDILRI